MRPLLSSTDDAWKLFDLENLDGSFRLSLPAPATYGFLLVWKDEAIVTADPRDPAHVEISVAPGQTVSGIALVFLGDEWRAISEAAPADTPSCP